MLVSIFCIFVIYFLSFAFFIPPGLVNSGLSDRLSELDFFICDFQISAGFDEDASIIQCRQVKKCFLCLI